MSFVTEVMVLGAIGSLVLGPKRVAKLTADVTRFMRKMKAMQNDLTRQLQSELEEKDLQNPKVAQPVTPSQGGLSMECAEPPA